MRLKKLFQADACLSQEALKRAGREAGMDRHSYLSAASHEANVGTGLPRAGEAQALQRADGGAP